METVVHNIRDLNEQEKTAAEQLVGHELRESQPLMIQVTDAVAVNDKVIGSHATEASWTNVYSGLSDDRIEELDKAIRQRANLTRTVE